MSLYNFIHSFFAKKPPQEREVISFEEVFPEEWAAPSRPKVRPWSDRLLPPPAGPSRYTHREHGRITTESLLDEGSSIFKHSGDNNPLPLDPEPFLEESSKGRSYRFEPGLVFSPRAGCDQNRENYVWKA